MEIHSIKENKLKQQETLNSFKPLSHLLKKQKQDRLKVVPESSKSGNNEFEISKIEEYRLYCLKEKYLYTNLNLLKMK